MTTAATNMTPNLFISDDDDDVRGMTSDQLRRYIFATAIDNVPKTDCTRGRAIRLR